MLTKLIQNYKENIPNNAPLAALNSAAATGLLSTAWGVSREERFRTVLAASIASVFDAIVIEPMVKTVFSDQSKDMQVLAKIGVVVLAELAVDGRSDIGKQLSKVSWLAILTAFIFNVLVMPENSAKVYVFS